MSDGGVDWDSLQTVPNALEGIRSTLTDSHFNYHVLCTSEVPGYFERTVGKVRVGRGKRVYALRFSDLTDKAKMLGALETSADFRKALYDFIFRAGFDFDNAAALENRIGLFYGIHVGPSSPDVLTFAQRVGAVGATPTQVNSYVSVQGKFPVALAQSRAKFEALRPDKPYISALYAYLLDLLEKFKLTPKKP